MNPIIIPLSGEDTALALVAALEYNGLKPVLVRMFAKEYNAETKEVILDRTEVHCEGLSLRFRSVPEEERDTPLSILEKQRAAMVDSLVKLAGGTAGGTGAGQGSGAGGAGPAPSGP